jgi:hypothetical protein
MFSYAPHKESLALVITSGVLPLFVIIYDLCIFLPI